MHQSGSRHVVVLAILGAVAVLAPQIASAGPFGIGPLVQVSGSSPFGGCTADNVAGQSGTLFMNSEVEPWIDVNPANPDNIVGIWQQDRWSNGGARSNIAGVSFDGGASWTAPVIIPGIAKCVGGIYDRATDPWVSFSPDGTVHQLALSFNDVNPPFVEGPGGDFDHALLASKSTDGGLTWDSPKEVIRDLDANVFNDKQSITADPLDSRLVYAVWDRLIFPPSEAASTRASFVSFAFRGPIWFSRTTDGGNRWEPARPIYDPGQESQTISSQIVVLPNGDLVNVFALIHHIRNQPPGRGAHVAIIRSTDKGVTWGPRNRAGKVTPIIVSRLGSIGISDPETGDPVRTGDIVPDIAVDLSTGKTYIVWQDARPNNNQADAILFSESTDGGFSWSRPVKVNQTPTDIPIGNQQAFTPSVDVSADGTIAVTYYDFRNNDAGADLKTDYFVVHCHPGAPGGCRDEGNWGDEAQLTPASFDMRQAPFAGGFFTGDYEGLASAGTDFTPFWSMPHGTDPSSAFFRRVGP
jgi:hypothetical protein